MDEYKNILKILAKKYEDVSIESLTDAKAVLRTPYVPIELKLMAVDYIVKYTGRDIRRHLKKDDKKKMLLRRYLKKEKDIVSICIMLNDRKVASYVYNTFKNRLSKKAINMILITRPAITNMNTL